jgi:hypothetical protein
MRRLHQKPRTAHTAAAAHITAAAITVAAIPLQPLHLHGSHGRDTATGRGVLFAAREFLKASLYTNVRDTSFVIQVSRPYQARVWGSLQEAVMRETCGHVRDLALYANARDTSFVI